MSFEKPNTQTPAERCPNCGTVASPDSGGWTCTKKATHDYPPEINVGGDYHRHYCQNPATNNGIWVAYWLPATRTWSYDIGGKVLTKESGHKCPVWTSSSCTTCGGDGLVDRIDYCSHGQMSAHSYCSHNKTTYHD